MRKTIRMRRLSRSWHGCVALRGVANAAKAIAVVALACLFAGLPLNMGISSPSYCAYASTWPTASSWDDVLVGFHDTYTSGKSSYVHSGADIQSPAGSKVVTPLAGKVSFVGSVPAGDTSGGNASQLTMNAVSIKIASGKTVTLMPVEDVTVSKGDSVAEGQTLACLAAFGDRSCKQTHLHIGLKENGVYYDPMSLFGATGASGAQATGALAGAAKKGKALSTGVEAAPATAAQSASAPNAQPAQESAGSVKGQEQESFGAISSKVDAASVVANTTSEDAQAGVLAFFEGVAAACQSQACSFAQGAAALCERAGLPVGLAVMLCLALPLLAVSLLASRIIVSIRRGRTRFQDRKIAPLFAKRGGASIHRLFPAPGTSFITRGRLAQRR